MNERERELLERIKARAKTLADAANHFKIPGNEPLTVLSLLYLALKIQGGPAEQAIMQGPVQALVQINELLDKQAHGIPTQHPDVEGAVMLTSEQLAMVVHAKMGMDDKGKKRGH